MELEIKCEECGKYVSNNDFVKVKIYKSEDGEFWYPMCSECVEKGLCKNCGFNVDPSEGYDSLISTLGLDLCETCSEKLLEGSIIKDIDTIDIKIPPEVVCLKCGKLEQLSIPGAEHFRQLELMDSKNTPILGLKVDTKTILDNLSTMNSDCEKLLDVEGIRIVSYSVLDALYYRD